jgi:3-oxoacyl-[acyl-carrier-protein] synthase II
MRITASSTISYQPTFRKKGFSFERLELSKNSTLIAPDYSGVIPAMDRRRMSDVLKMSIACSMDCLEQAGLKQPDAIIVGTSMGCCTHTRNFLDKIISSQGGLISPTSFILSTHNTIAGQLSLHLKNHSYNITHTQNSLSFEHALLDAMVCINDEHNHVLVGGADEMEETLFDMKARLSNENLQSAFGASFFVLSRETTDSSTVILVDVRSHSLINGSSETTKIFLESNKLTNEDIDLVLYSDSTQKTTVELQSLFGEKKLFDYQKICGTWFTNSAFAMGYGIDVLSQRNHPLFGENIHTVLVFNNLVPENLGLILLKR